MEITVSITSAAKLAALSRARLAYNQSNPEMSEQEFVQRLLDGQLDTLVRSYTISEMPPFTWLKTRFTMEERAAIREAALTDGAVADLCAMTDKADVIHFDDPLTMGGVALLEAKGLLAPGRGAEILAL